MPASVTLMQLEYFLASVQHGSFSSAAEALFIAQSSLSEQIRRLEKALGAPLFVRTNRSLILTEAGRTLIPYARRAVDSVSEAVGAVDPVRTLSGGSVSFGTFSTAHHFLNSELIARFSSRFPGVRIRVMSTNSVQVAESVRTGDLEAGLVALPIDERGLKVSEPVWTSESVFLSSDRRRTRRPIGMRELGTGRLILPEVHWGDHDPIRRRLVEMARVEGVTITPHIEVDSAAVALDLAQRGMGDTITSLGLARALGATDVLSWTPLGDPLRTRFAVITRQEAEPSPAVEVLTHMARGVLAALPSACA